MSAGGFNKYREEASGLNAGFQFLDELDKLMAEAIVAGGTGDVRGWWRALDGMNILTSAFVLEADFLAVKQKLDEVAEELWNPRMTGSTMNRGMATWKAQVESNAYMKLRDTQVMYYQSARKLLMPMVRFQSKGEFYTKLGVGTPPSGKAEQ